MERAGSEPYTHSPQGEDGAPGGDPSGGGAHSKRIKELENAALQTTLTSRMEAGSHLDPDARRVDREPAEGEQSNGVPFNHRHRPAAPLSAPGSGEAEEEEAKERAEEAEERVEEASERVEEERTLTDHLNKRLLSSFLEKLNERDLALPGVRRLDCAVGEEDSNRAAEDW